VSICVLIVFLLTDYHDKKAIISASVHHLAIPEEYYAYIILTSVNMDQGLFALVKTQAGLNDFKIETYL